MSRTSDFSKQPSQSTTSFQPTTSFLQTRDFAPLQMDLDEDAVSWPSRNGENLLEKIINQGSIEPSDTLVQAKPINRLKPLQAKRMATIQAKLSIGESNDKYEQEADATASKVVQQINSPIQVQSVQRQESTEEEDEELQMKPISTIHRQESMEEEDEELQMKPISTIHRQESMEEEDEELQMKPISTIHRQESMEEEDEELQMKSLVQRRENIGGGEASTDLESSIQSARGNGQSLDASLQAKMGQAMGADFSSVKVHTDSQSDQLNKSIQAKAFTTGQDVFFRQGAYNPSSRGGQELIAHELTHVVQQNGNHVQRQPNRAGRDFIQNLNQSKKYGKSLPTQLRRQAEKSMGANLSGVRIHTDLKAGILSRSIQARAFTTGQDIFFDRGQYNPGHNDGKRLIVHELAHVVQNQKSNVSESIQAKAEISQSNAHSEIEADAAIDTVLSGQRTYIQAKPSSLIQRATYSTLGATQKAQVDAIAEDDYYKQAEEFEGNLGLLASKAPEAKSSANEMLKRVKKLVDAWALETASNVDQEYVNTFGQLDYKSAGSIMPIAEDIKAVFNEGSLRERLTLVYSAIRSDKLQTLLQLAYQDVSQKGKDINFKWVDKNSGMKSDKTMPKGFADKAGLKKHLKKNTAVTNDIGNRIAPNQAVNERSSLFARNEIVTKTERSGEKQFVTENAQQGVQRHETFLGLKNKGIGMSTREIRQQLAAYGKPMTQQQAIVEAGKLGISEQAYLEQEFLKVSTGKLDAKDALVQWVPGEHWYKPQMDSELVIKASQIKAKLRAGISGTTDMYLHAAQYLGMTSKEDLQNMRLAMLGWMLPFRDHSFYEIMTSATSYGLTDFDPNAPAYQAYEKEIPPLSKSRVRMAAPRKLRSNRVPDGALPGYYLSPPESKLKPTYKDIIASDILPGSGMMVRNESETDIFVSAGVPRGLVETLPDLEFQNLNSFRSLVASLNFVTPDTDPSTNDVQLQTAITSPSFNILKTSANVGAVNANLMLAAFLKKLHPNFVLPKDLQNLATLANIMIPQEKGKRFTNTQLSSINPDTDPTLINPQFGTKLGSAKSTMEGALKTNKVKFTEDVLEHDPTKYSADPDKMNAWFQVHSKPWIKAFPQANLEYLKMLNEARKKVKGTPQEIPVETLFDKTLEQVMGLSELTVAERSAISMYTVSQVANDMNSAVRTKDQAKTDKYGKPMELILSAMEKMPAYNGGPVYRGDANRGYQVGKIIHYQEFVSTAKTVNSSFLKKDNQGWMTHAVVIEKHKTGKDAMALSNYSFSGFNLMEGEILFAPGSRFVVKRIEDLTHLRTSIQNLSEQLKATNTAIEDANNTGQPTDQLILKRDQLKHQLTATRKQSGATSERMNFVWVFMDEV